MRHYMPVLVYGHDGDIRADMVEVEPYNGLYCLSREAYAEIDRLRASISVDDIMESDIEAVEEETGIGRGAWDMADHRELIMACVKVVCRKTASRPT